MSQGLTPRLAELLGFISRSIKANGHAPSYAEMATALGVSSRGAIAGMLDRLEDRGFIHRVARSARSLSVIDQGGLPPELEGQIKAYCRAAGIARPTFDKRAAESLLRGARS